MIKRKRTRIQQACSSLHIPLAGHIDIVGAKHDSIPSLEPGVQGGGAFLQVHGEGYSLVLGIHPLGQSLKLVGPLFGNFQMVVPA